MKKTIIIDGKECKFKSSAMVPRIYRIKFHRDIFVDLAKIEKSVRVQEKLKKELAESSGEEAAEEEFGSTLPIDSLEMFENIAYVMHKHGDPKQPDNIDDWLDQFETFDIYQVLPDVLEMWKLENQQLSIPKKKTGK